MSVLSDPGRGPTEAPPVCAPTACHPWPGSLIPQLSTQAHPHDFALPLVSPGKL